MDNRERVENICIERAHLQCSIDAAIEAAELGLPDALHAIERAKRDVRLYVRGLLAELVWLETVESKIVSDWEDNA